MRHMRQVSAPVPACSDDRGRQLKSKCILTLMIIIFPAVLSYEVLLERPVIMDPATAIGLVSGILSFVGAAEKILKLSWTLYHSVEGSSEETETRSKVAESMAVIGKRIVPDNQTAVSEEDRALVALAQECGDLTNDIKKELQGLKPKRRKSKTQSGFVALKTFMVEPKIKDLEKRLQHCRGQLHFHIAALSSENLKTLLATYKQEGAKLTRLELSVSQLRQTLQDTTTSNANSISSQAIDQLQILLSLGQNTLNEVAQDRILRGIKAGFKDMSYRYQSVERPFGQTFEWVLDLNGSSPEATKFIQWLSSGDGIFHICGKLGSGKSTLMKKLFGHERSRAELDKWAQSKGGRQLVVANFFFYALGSDPRQKSLIGLYRTLLHQILTASPGLIRNLLPDQWTEALSQPKVYSTYEILDDDIKQAFERLSKHWNDNSMGGYCFCFFIDGLDEYQVTTAVDRREMVCSLTDLANNSSGNFKLCVSSRMENPFMDMFSEDNRFYLHELTKSDMKEYVKGNLQYVGTKDQRRQLASSITKKAEGIFLWVVLVVQNIRRQADDGARFSRLLSEIESLPTEMNDLFQRILDSLGATDRRRTSCTVSILRFLGRISQARKKRLWLTLSDFYFLEDYETDAKFAEDVHFLLSDLETVRRSRRLARRQLRGACRGLVESDKKGDLDFTHRSVGDFFNQHKVREKLHDKPFNNLEALSQLKLATVRQYWWDVDRQNDENNKEERQREENAIHDHSILAASLVVLRRRERLDSPPFRFFECLDSIPQLSVRKTVSRTLASHKTAFHIHLPQGKYTERPPHRRSHFEICHTSRVRHNLLDYNGDRIDGSESGEAHVGTEDPAVLWRAANEEVDDIKDYSTAMVSPLLIELSLGRLKYPIWRTRRIHDMPMEPESLTMLTYYAIATAIGRIVWKEQVLEDLEDGNGSDGGGETQFHLLAPSGLNFLRHLFKQKIVSPNLPTHLAYGGEFGFVRIAAGSQPLSIWQHFLCWWATVAAASGEFEPEMDSSSAIEISPENEHWHVHECTNNPSEGQRASWTVLKTFITNGADLHLAMKIGNGKELDLGQDDAWIQYFLEIIPDGGEALKVDIVVNLKTRMELGCDYPYGPPKCRWRKEFQHEDGPTRQSLPKSPLSVRDWMSRSRLPERDALLKLIDERLGAENLDDIRGSIPRDVNDG